MFERIVNFFMPVHLRGNLAHPEYHKFRVLVSTCLIGLPLMLLFPVPLYYMGKPIAGYIINDVLVILTLFSTRLLGHYLIPMTVTALVTYFIIYQWIRDSGLIYSSNVSLLHMYLLCAIWAHKRIGWWAIFSNVALFVFIYYQTLQAGLDTHLHQTLGGPLYALGMNILITVFFGGFLAYLQMDQERDRIKIKLLQERKITLLDEAVKQRTEQLNSMREVIATDFHDETGNMISAITRQADMLKHKFPDQHEAQPIVNNIIKNCDRLYASGKDFLWHLNHDSEDPDELFYYLMAYGQQYYNQFDIAFSSDREDGVPAAQLAPFAALNLIYIFKEAMNNVVKHANAQEVLFEMHYRPGQVIYSLLDNGRWKATDNKQPHYGLSNMEKRCARNNFAFTLTKKANGTCIAIAVPLKTEAPVV